MNAIHERLHIHHGVDGLRALFNALDELRRTYVEGRAPVGPRRLVRLIAAFRACAASVPPLARRVVHVVTLLAAVLFLHVLALALAERAYAPYQVGGTGERTRNEPVAEQTLYRISSAPK